MNGSSRITPAPVEQNAPVAGNARLTALVGVALLLLFTAEVGTVVLGVNHVLAAHVAIGVALTPVVVLKLGSTGWRVAQYYRGNGAYVSRGAPRLYLRILGPLLSVLTVALLGSGLLAFAGPHALHDAALTTHKVSFYPWLAALLLHVVVHCVPALRLSGADLLARSRARVAGATIRRYAVLTALTAGAVLAVILTSHAGDYLHLYPHR
jgi:hypothetical protein